MYIKNTLCSGLLRASVVMPILAMAISINSTSPAIAGDTPCHPLGNREIVRLAREQIDAGESTESVTNALTCVVEDVETGGNLRITAIRAGFALQIDDANARTFLLAMISEVEPRSLAEGVAWELLTYVADEEAQHSMFEIFLDRWTSHPTPTYFEYFRALKDREFLAWLDKRLEMGDHAPLLSVWLEAEAELIRIQEDSERVLEYIASPGRPFGYRTWLTRHALRCGVTRAELRDACLTIFQRDAAIRHSYIAKYEILKALDELHAFDEEHGTVVESLRDARARRKRLGADIHLYEEQPWVEEIIARKRAVFLGVNASQADGQ